ncbi:hypothetical protein ILUMI_24123 [Ignelater luminosus]|uniref:Uncharacterized protein n=1 Tax=Ignelater luminosus TaxID=2038154 RepID=A0A8K0CAU2_IGNLU|nr:hypothetical protein ILUMI_24123 [Ignelater luminosus]
MFLVFRKRPLRKKEIQQLAGTFCADPESDVEPYEDSGSEYLESENSSSESDLESPKQFLKRKTNNFLPALRITQNIQVTIASQSSEKDDTLQNLPPSNPPANKHDLVGWDDVDDQLVHRMKIPDDKARIILAVLNKSSSELDIFPKLFPNKDERGTQRSGNALKHSEIMSVVKHISIFSAKQTHYGTREHKYLDAELNVKIIHSLFLEKQPKSKVKYEYYNKVFRKNFNLSFGRPQVDVFNDSEILSLKLKNKSLKDIAKRVAAAELRDD